MKTITPFNNTPTKIHVKELPTLTNPHFAFGFNTGWVGQIPTLRINVDFLVSASNNEQIKVATYNSGYKVEGEGLVLEDHVYACIDEAIYSMKRFALYDKIGRSIPQELFLCPSKEAFQEDLIDLAKAMNAIEGKRGFPPPKEG